MITYTNIMKQKNQGNQSGQSQRTQTIQWTNKARETVCEVVTFDSCVFSYVSRIFKLLAHVQRNKCKPIAFRHSTKNRSSENLCHWHFEIKTAPLSKDAG